MYWSSLSTAANPAAYQANPTGYAVGHTPAAGTYSAQRAPSTYDGAYTAATSHASASYPTAASSTYEYGYPAQRASQPVAAAAAVYDASKSYYSQPSAAAAAVVAATAATSYTAADSHYQAGAAAANQRTSVAAAKGSFSGTAYSSAAQATYNTYSGGAGKGPYAQQSTGSKNTWNNKKTPMGSNRSHYKNKLPPRPQQLHYCDVCKISCAGPQTYREHLEGQKHKKKEHSVKAGPTPSRVGASLRCELCDVTCTGSDAYAAHIRGAKHQKVVKLHQKLGKPIPSDDPVVVGKGSSSSNASSKSQTASASEKKAENEKELAELKEKDVEPVGQEYIEEIKGTEGDTQGGSKVISFNCKLCDCRFNDPNAKEMHMKGRRHRLQYKKKVNPDLHVENRGSVKHRKIHEDRIRKSLMRDERRRMNEERVIDEEHWIWEERRRLEEEMEFGDWMRRFPRPHPMAPPHLGGRMPFLHPHMPHLMPMRRVDSSDDRHVMAKHLEIYPTDDELQAIQNAVSTTEKALKLVSDYLADLDTPKIKTEDKTDKSEDSNNRVLKGVMRIGVLAKGLLLRGDTSLHLVLLCADKPTRTLLDRVADALPQHLSSVSGSNEYEVVRVVEEAGVQVIHNSLTVTITLTSPVMREAASQELQASLVKDAPDVLDKVKCLDALAALRHAKWFQARANGLQSCVMVTRILRDFCQRTPQWSVLNAWALELMVEKVISSCGQPMSPGDAFRRVFEAVSAGILLPHAAGLYDPCEKEPTDASSHLTPQEREEMTATAQHVLRLIAFRQIHKVLAIDAIPTHKFMRGMRFTRKRRRDNSQGDASEMEAGGEGKKEKKEEVEMETK